MYGTVFNVQRFSIQDGPGIRTTVFLKGCPLHCAWCHNPESQSRKNEIAFYVDKCISCGQCAAVCKTGAHIFSEGKHIYRRERCTACGECAKACYMRALESIGYQAEVSEILKEVLADRDFYIQSDGGMTISGGEPLAQFKFTLALAKAAKAVKLHVCVETCGAGQWNDLYQLAEYVDLFLYDYKVTDSKQHKAYTGECNELLLLNLKKLDEAGSKTILRCPMIPDVNINDGHILGIIQQANLLKHCVEINLEPYHPLGISKCEQLGKKILYSNTQFLSRESLEPIRNRIQSGVSVPVKII